MAKHKPGEDGRPTRPTAETCVWIRTVAYQCARRAGMTSDESEDCAANAQAQLLELEREGRLHAQHLRPAWLYRCLDNHARNEARAARRRHFREETLDYDEPPVRLRAPLADIHEQPEPEAMRAELQARIERAALRLSAADRSLFQDRCICGRPVDEVASELNRTPGAVREASRTMRRRLMRHLDRDGLTGPEAAEYLRIIGQGWAPGRDGSWRNP